MPLRKLWQRLSSVLDFKGSAVAGPNEVEGKSVRLILQRRSVFAKDHEVGRLGSLESFPRVGGRGDGDDELIDTT